MNQANNNETKYQPNVETYLSKYLLGAPLSNEEISEIASLSESEQMELTISITSESLRNIDDLSLVTNVAALMFGQISTDNQNMGYNIESNIKQTTFQLNSQKIALEREKQKGISR